MGIKKGKWCDEHWLLYTSDHFLNSTPETNDLLSVGYLNLNLKKGGGEDQQTLLLLFTFLIR